MDWRHPSLPPLLRSLGTLLIVVVSVVVGVSEHRVVARAEADVARARELAGPDGAEAGVASGEKAALIREMQWLRLQLRDSDLADEVFENPWFQGLGALATLMVALSFFVEAWQKRPPRPEPPPS